MDGFESVRRYRTYEKAHLLPGQTPLFILGMSANNDDESIREALAAGMNAFVAKPFNYEKLVDVLVLSEWEVCMRLTPCSSRSITPPRQMSAGRQRPLQLSLPVHNDSLARLCLVDVE